MNHKFILSFVLCLGTVLHTFGYEKMSVSTQAYLDNRQSGITDKKYLLTSRHRLQDKQKDE